MHFVTDDIIHLMRGQIYNIDGRKIFTFGGAYSIDRDERIEGISWYAEELPSQEEYEEAWQNLEKADFEVDYVIMHTAPEEVVANLGFGADEGAIYQQQKFQEYIDELSFGHLYFGHFHVDEDIDDIYHCLMDRIIELD